MALIANFVTVRSARLIRTARAKILTDYVTPIPPTPQPGVPLVGWQFPLAEGLYAPCPASGTNITSGGSGGGSGGTGGGTGGGVPDPTTYAAMIEADAPVSFWRLSDDYLVVGQAAINATDEVGGNTGQYLIENTGGGGLAYTPLTAPLITQGGETDQSATFGGFGYINVGIGAGLQLQRFTLEALIRMSVAPASGVFAQYPIVSYDASNSQAFGKGYHLYITGASKLAARIGDGAGAWFAAVGTTTLVAGVTYHIAATWDGYALRVYVNGVLEATLTTAGVTISYANATGLTIALDPAGANPPYKYKGVLDEIAIYPAALDAAALLRHKVKALG